MYDNTKLGMGGLCGFFFFFTVHVSLMQVAQDKLQIGFFFSFSERGI